MLPDNLASRNLNKIVTDAYNKLEETDLILLANVTPSDDPRLQRYGKSSLTADLQYIGYDVVRAIYERGDGIEDASYLVIKPDYYHISEFIEDIARISLKYRIRSFILWDHEEGNSKEFVLDEDSDIYRHMDEKALYGIDDILKFMSSYDGKGRRIVSSTLAKSAWTSKTKCYRIDHSRDDVFDRWGHKPEYDTPLNWKPASW